MTSTAIILILLFYFFYASCDSDESNETTFVKMRLAVWTTPKKKTIFVNANPQ